MTAFLPSLREGFFPPRYAAEPPKRLPPGLTPVRKTLSPDAPSFVHREIPLSSETPAERREERQHVAELIEQQRREFFARERIVRREAKAAWKQAQAQVVVRPPPIKIIDVNDGTLICRDRSYTIRFDQTLVIRQIPETDLWQVKLDDLDFICDTHVARLLLP